MLSALRNRFSLFFKDGGVTLLMGRSLQQHGPDILMFTVKSLIFLRSLQHQHHSKFPLKRKKSKKKPHRMIARVVVQIASWRRWAGFWPPSWQNPSARLPNFNLGTCSKKAPPPWSAYVLSLWIYKLLRDFSRSSNKHLRVKVSQHAQHQSPGTGTHDWNAVFINVYRIVHNCL